MKLSFPILFLLFAINTTGLIVSAVFFSRAYNDLHGALDALRLQLAINLYSKTISLIIFILFPIAFLYLILCILIRFKKKYIFIATANVLGWIILLFLLAYTSMISVWTVATYIADKGSAEVIDTVQPFWDKLTGFYNKTVDLVNNIPNVSTGANGTNINTPIGNINIGNVLGNIPIPPIGNTNIGNITEDIIARLKGSINGTCPIICLDLNGQSWLEPGNNCICNLTRLETAQGYFHSCWYNFGVTIIGCVIMFIGLSWLLMYSSSCFTKSKLKQRTLLVS
jgi:ABC-type multidrug transport system fused ATPase/permease subunit